MTFPDVPSDQVVPARAELAFVGRDSARPSRVVLDSLCRSAALRRKDRDRYNRPQQEFDEVLGLALGLRRVVPGASMLDAPMRRTSRNSIVRRVPGAGVA